MTSHQHDSDHFHSPSDIAMSGHEFSPEDIQDLLGGVLRDDESVTAHSAFPPGYHGSNEPSLNANETSQLGATASGQEVSSSNATTAAATSTSNEVSGDARALARSERKRKMEKQRRSDVNKQFGELSTLLRQIETEAPDHVRGLPAYSPANRVDLIARTVALLRNLHEHNKKQKVVTNDLQDQLENAKKAGEETAAKLKEAMMSPQAMGNNKVMMMVPMLIPSGENASGPAVPMMHPWMPPTPAGFMPPPPPSGRSAPHQTTNSSTTTSSAGGAAPMPWMMPSPSMQWMMPSMPMMSSSEEKSAGTDSEKVSSNLAHCA